MPRTTISASIALAIVFAPLPSLHAQIVRYAEDFEAPVTIGSTVDGPALTVQIDDIDQSPGGWQVLGGTSGVGTVTLTAGIDNGGVAGSQALFANWNQTGAAASNFVFNQYNVVGLPGFPAGIAEADVTISLDIFMSGSETSNSPITVVFAGNNGTINRPFFPVLANNQYTHVEFLLSQTGGSAVDLTQPFNLRLLHSGNGFGFDANNIVRIDNVSVYAVPEPVGASLLAIAALGIVALRRHRGDVIAS
jgi:hypothetical protein